MSLWSFQGTRALGARPTRRPPDPQRGPPIPQSSTACGLRDNEVDVVLGELGSPDDLDQKNESIDGPSSLRSNRSGIPRKEVIQPHLPVRLPCYDFTPIINPTFDGCLPQGVSPPASGVADFRGVTGGVYKARERIHPGVADPGLLATPTSWSRVADSNPN